MQKITTLCLLLCLCSCVTTKKRKHTTETRSEATRVTQIDTGYKLQRDSSAVKQTEQAHKTTEQETIETKIEEGIDTLLHEDSTTTRFRLVAGQDAAFETETQKVTARWNDSTGSFDVVVTTKPKATRINTKRTTTSKTTRQKEDSTAIKKQEAVRVQAIDSGYHHQRDSGGTVQASKTTLKEKETQSLPIILWATLISAAILYIAYWIIYRKRPAVLLWNKITGRKS